MAEILHVNTILTDPKKKEVYDQFGSKVRGERCFNHVQFNTLPGSQSGRAFGES